MQVLVPLGLAAQLVATASAADTGVEWPSLRGPRHDGTTAARLEASAGAGFAVAWRAALGAGYSSVAVAEGRAITLVTDGDHDLAVAFDARSGRELWRYAVAPAWRGRDGSFDGPIATPALAGGKVYGLGPRGHLFALDAATGRESWKVDLVAREGAAVPAYGFTSSPLVVEGVLIVGLGAKDKGAIAGFDPRTGAKLWVAGRDHVSYQSPVVMEIGGRARVIAVGDTTLLVVDPMSGRTLAEHLHGGERLPMAAESMVPVPAGDGRVFLKLKQDNAAMLRIAPRPGGELEVATLWVAPVLRSTYVVPVYHEGHLYGMNGRATLTCVDAATGAVRWRSREPGDGFPLLVGGDLVILTKENTLHVSAASPDGWQERARVALSGDMVWSLPGFADGAIFARSQKEITRVDWASGSLAATMPSKPAPSSPRFARFLAEVGQAADKAAAVDRFLGSLPPGHSWNRPIASCSCTVARPGTPGSQAT